MDKDLMHLARITIDNLPNGSATFTEAEIIDAMERAVSKEESMTMQLLKSSTFYGKPEVIACFKRAMADMVYESVNAQQ